MRNYHGVNFLQVGSLPTTTTLPFANIVFSDGNPEEGLRIRQLPHYVLRLSSHLTAARSIVMLRFDNVTWDSRKHEEKIVIELLSGWLKNFMEHINAIDPAETFELMPSVARPNFGMPEKKEGVKEDEFLLEEAKKMFQCIAAHTQVPGRTYMGHLGPRMSVHTHLLDTDTPSFSLDGSWNQSSYFNLAALGDKPLEDFRKEVSSSSNTYHDSFLSATTTINGRTCSVQVRDEVLGDLFPRMVNRASVEEEINKIITKWTRASFGADLIGNVSLKFDWIEREVK